MTANAERSHPNALLWFKVNPHPGYGPCDAMRDDGGCAECGRLIAAHAAERREWMIRGAEAALCDVCGWVGDDPELAGEAARIVDALLAAEASGASNRNGHPV